MQEAPYSEPWKQLPADAAITLWRTHRVDPAGAEGQPPRVPACGAGRVPTVEEEQPGGGGRPVQHPAIRSQRAALAGRQGTGLNREHGI